MHPGPRLVESMGRTSRARARGSVVGGAGETELEYLSHRASGPAVREPLAPGSLVLCVEPVAEGLLLASVHVVDDATYDDPVEGMFGFFPCVPFRERRRAALRPVVHLDAWTGLPPQRLPALWRDLVRQVQDASCLIGIRRASEDL